ncbi:MAG: HAMP domain-containing histidine kinase [bacterium]|nr:HAMP domain-containing histidine kinase [bacterium]
MFDQNKITYNEDVLKDVFLPNNFIKSLIDKVRNFYFTNMENIDKINTTIITTSLHEREMNLEFIILHKDNKYFFVLSNDSYIRYEFFRTNILNTLSHELKTPLTIIKGYVQYVMKSLPEKNALMNIMSVILNETYRLEEIISELIEVSKFYSNSVIIKKDIFSVNSLVNMVINKFEPKIKSKGVSMSVEIQNNDFEIVADFEKMKYVISELIENSIKYGKDKIFLRCFEDTEGFYFEIADNGKGMSKEIIKNLFNLFIRTENELNRKIYGLGVGLFLVKKIVEAHGGEVYIKSKINRGTKVTIFIPRTFSAAASLFAGE